MCRLTATVSKSPPTTSSSPTRTGSSSCPGLTPPTSSSSLKSSTIANIRCIPLLKSFTPLRRRSNSLDESRTTTAMPPPTSKRHTILIHFVKEENQRATMSSRAKGVLSRRSFLRWSQSAMALLGAAPIVGVGKASEALALPAASNSADDYYAKLGVETIINAAGTYTYLTAALMPVQVQRAVAQAALHPVRLKDLQPASGEYLA